MKLTMNKKKRAQAGNQAAILIIVITVLLVLFLLAIPPEDRAKLLNGEDPIDNDDPHRDFTTLIRANPGKIEYLPHHERIHEFAPFNLNADTRGEIIHTKSSAYLKNSVFEKISDTTTFRADPHTTSNLLLNFNVQQGRGTITILLNNEIIFNAPIPRGNSPPIHIPTSLIREHNTLEFKVSGPGAAFWRYNYYELRDINIYADVLDLTRSKTTQAFNVGRQEANELETSELRYLPACTPGTVQDLTIEINDFQVFKGTPDCEIFNTIPIPTHYLLEGVNHVTFQIRQGRVLIDRARIQNKLEQPDITTYYFQVREKYFDIEGDDYELNPRYESMLQLTFPNHEQKRFELIINGKPMNFNTARLRETRNMQMFLQPGTNSIQIEPRSELTITELRITIRER